MDLNVSIENKTMPELVLSGQMIEAFTEPDGFRRLIANYQTQLRAKREYYLRHREEILAKRRQKYAQAHPQAVRRRGASEDGNQS